MSVNSKMTAIADAIRNLLDISGPMGLDAMANNISSITKRGAVAGTISTKAEQYIIPDGYHNGNGSVGIADAEQAKIIAENIKSGVTILGVAGSASGEIFSIIAVTYPAGSTCTCSDGTTTLTARDTSGKALFNVPIAGTWTVTARKEDGSKEKSIDVTITAAGQVELVTLDYLPYLYINGDECTDLTGGWVSEAKGINSGGPTGLAPTVVRGSTLEISLNGPTVGGIVRTNNKIDLTKYSSIKFNGEMVNPTDNHDGWLQICVWSNIGTYYMDNRVASYIVRAHQTINDAAIDISSLSGSFYVGFALFSAGQTMSISVDSLLLE